MKDIEDKIAGKITSTASTIGKPKEDNNNIYLYESVRISNNIRRILLSLFALIGFITLVFAISAATVRVGLVQIATNVFIAFFIAAIVGAFTLFAVVVYQIRSSETSRRGK